MGQATPVKKGKTNLPNLLAGYIMCVVLSIASYIAIAFFRSELTKENPSTEAALTSIVFIIFELVLFIYWLICIHRIHKVLLEATDGTYPIRPGRAVGFHFLPFYNIYWIFKWPSEVVKFININSQNQKLKPYVPGILIFIGFIFREFDGGIGMLIAFVALKDMVKNIRVLVQAPTVTGS